VANIGEAGEQLSHVLNPDDSTGLISLLQAAAARAEIELDIAVGATAGSSTEEASVLRDRLHTITSGLGELANSALQGIQEKTALLAQWGITSVTAADSPPPFAAPPVNTPAPRTVTTPEQLPKPEPIDEALDIKREHMGHSRTSRLAASGIHTLRDALVAGSRYMENIRGIGGQVIHSIRYHVQDVCRDAGLPEQQITPMPTVGDIAASCTDLRQVSFAALHSTSFSVNDGFTLGFNNRRVSVHDLITMTPDELITYSDSRPSTAFSRETALTNLKSLIEQAHVFAAEFDREKRRLP